jgi:hypothetical protein
LSQPDANPNNERRKFAVDDKVRTRHLHSTRPSPQHSTTLAARH